MTNELPSQAILYRWPTVFGPIVTFSFYWRHGKKARGLRAYFESDDPKIAYAKREPTLLAFVSLENRTIVKLLETDLRSIANLSTLAPADEPFVSDFAAARLWAMDNLNKPSTESTPEDRLRHGFIKRLEEEVRQAIACVAENDFAEEILNEAERMQALGLEDCYRAFPYQRGVYAFCKAKLAEKYDIFFALFLKFVVFVQRPRRPDSAIKWSN